MKFRTQYSAEILALAVGCAAVGLLLGVVLTSMIYLRKSSTLAAELESKAERLQLLEQVLPQLVQLNSTGAVSAEFEVVTSAKSLLDVQVEPVPTDKLQSPPGGKVAVGSASPAVQSSQPRMAAPAQQRLNPALASRPATSNPSMPQSSPIAAGPVATERVAETVRSSAPSGMAEATGVPALQPLPPPVTSEELAASVKNQVEGVPADKVGVARIDAGGVHLASGRYIRVGERFSTGERLLKVDPANDRVVTSDRQLLIFFNR
jgi:hypothetical protein